MNVKFPSHYFRCVTLPMLAAFLLTLGGCNLSFEQDPATTVTIEISGINDDDDCEEVQETLMGMADGSSHSMTTFRSGDKMTINLSPVGDVRAFSRKINFGEVTEVEGRTVKVRFVE